MGFYEPGVPAYWAAVKAQRRAPAHYSAGNASAAPAPGARMVLFACRGGCAVARVVLCVLLGVVGARVDGA